MPKDKDDRRIQELDTLTKNLKISPQCCCISACDMRVAWREWPFTLLLTGKMDTNDYGQFGRQLPFPESDGEQTSIWPGPDTSADATNVCFPLPSNNHPHQLRGHPQSNLHLTCSTPLTTTAATDSLLFPRWTFSRIYTLWGFCLLVPACFRLALCSCHETTRSALCAITE